MKIRIHLKILGALYSLISIAGICDALYALVIGAILAQHPDNAAGDIAYARDYFFIWKGLVGFALSAFLLHFGISLWRQRKWALGITGYLISALMLIAFPLGTILGVYTIIILIAARAAAGSHPEK